MRVIPTVVFVLANSLSIYSPTRIAWAEAEGEVHYERFTYSEMKAANLEELNETGLAQAFEAWVMAPTYRHPATVAALPETGTPRSTNGRRRRWPGTPAWRFWGRLESREEYRSL